MKRTTWSDFDIEYLKKNLGNTPCKEIAKKLNKSISSIYHKASRLGLKGRYFEYKDKLKDFDKTCKHCGKPIVLKKKHCYTKMFETEYCSRRCATLGTGRGFKKNQVSWNKGMKYSDKRKEMMSKLMKKMYKERPELLERFNSMKKGRPSVLKGKNFEEFFGEDKAKKIKQKIRNKTLEQYESGKFPNQTHTKPEMEFKEILVSIGYIEKVDFFHQKKLFDKFFCDFVFPNKEIIFEVQGDYWHANPMFYPYNLKKPEQDLNQIQVKNIKKDKAKEAYLRKRGWTLIPIWEFDIYNNKMPIKQAVKKILNCKP